jgi:hypothetical protein
MKKSKTTTSLFISFGYPLAIVFALTFASRISAQQKFTVQLTNGVNQQVPVDGLKLTFDNNGSFSYWRNGLKQDMAFIAVGIIYFTDLTLPSRTNETLSFCDGLKVYPTPTTGIVNIEFSKGAGMRTEILVMSVVGAEIYRKEMIDAAKFRIDLSNQANGLYLLKINNTENQYIGKIIILK